MKIDFSWSKGQWLDAIRSFFQMIIDFFNQVKSGWENREDLFATEAPEETTAG